MVRKASKNDVRIIADLAAFMWKNNSVEELADEFSEMISSDDAQIFLKYENDISLQFHKAMNFTEANRIICFTKKL